MVIFFSALATWLLLFALIPLLRRRLLDQPNARSSHRMPTPRGGGIAFVLVVVLACIVWFLPPVSVAFTAPSVVNLPLMLLPLAVVGLVDDRYNLPPSWRYGSQVLSGLALIYHSALPLSWFSLLPLLVAITAVINFINFMDGLDGLVASSMAVAIAVVAFQLSLPWPIWSLVGALLGFLLWNWSPAKVFMGDVGSTFLGAIFVGLALQAPTWRDALGLLLVATPLLADSALCVLRRWHAGQPVFQAHRLHLYQRLHQAGWPHPHVSCLYLVATTLLAAAMMCGGLSLVVLIAVLELLLGFWLDQTVAIPFTAALAISNQRSEDSPA